MAESPDRTRPANQPPGGYLPRIAKFEAPEVEAPRKKKAKKGDAKPEKEGPEEVPAFETVEGRRRARLVVGASAVGGFFLVGGVIFLATRGGNEEAPADDLSQGLVPIAAPSEDNARDLYRRAEEAARRGQQAQALAFLDQIARDHPRTNTANQAREAQERADRGLPLFLEGPIVQAVRVEPAPPPATAAVNLPPEPAATTPPVDVSASTRILGPTAPAGSTLPRASVAARPLPSGFLPRTEAGVHESGWPIEIVCERDGAVMVLVPASTFTLGRDNGARNEAPARQVKLTTFYVDQHEVTRAQYDRFREATSRAAPPTAKGEGPEASAPDRPIVMVTFHDAQAFAAWAGKTLPSEAQWELTARATDGRVFPWGNDPPQWDKPRAPHQVDPVFSNLRDMSPYGAFDLAGNVWEWTVDTYDVKAYQNIKFGQVNPITTGRSTERSVRGGAKDWQATWRAGVKADGRMPHLGFRCVLVVEEGPVQAAPEAPGRSGQPVPF